MSIVDVLMNSVGVSSRDNVHAEIAASFHHVAEWIGVPEPFASVMHGNLRGIEGDASASAETSAIHMTTPEVIEPELGIVVAGIVFYEGHLRPAHGPVVPAAF